MKNRKTRRISLFTIDILIIAGVYLGLKLLTIADINSVRVKNFGVLPLLAFCLCVMGLRSLFDIYNSVWRYANVSSFFKLVISDIVGGALFFGIGRMVEPINIGFAFSVFLMLSVLLTTLCSRFVYQLTYQHNSTKRHALAGNKVSGINMINVAIIGAGNIGATLADEFNRNKMFNYNPYVFIDNDPSKIGSKINGIDILAENDGVVDKIKSLPIQEIVIALPNLSAQEIQRLYNLYSQTGCKVKIYEQPMSDAIEGGPIAMRELKIEDLLFRDTISVKTDATRNFYKGKCVLVTGGGGSIGSELCRQVAKCSPSKLVILDIYENNAYDIQQELIQKYKEKLDLEVVIASVRDRKRLDEIFSQYRPEIVFHAAAHKHVPLMEKSSMEAIKNNVHGTKNVADIAEKYGVKKFLLISTDKAVNPTNIMGASKRLCEMIVQSRRDSATEFVAVRFGNVLGSNGSVIPLFTKQIKAGGPVTITDKRIIRYFMTIKEAVGLVMETCFMAKGGELYVLDMGDPVKILDLAERMISLSGKKPYEDIDIVEIGLRPGEKLYEELLMSHENQDKTDNEKIFIERDKPYTVQEVENKIAILDSAVEVGSYEEIKKAIKETVPTFKEPEKVNSKVEE